MSQLFLISNWKTFQNGHACWVSCLIMKGTLLNMVCLKYLQNMVTVEGRCGVEDIHTGHFWQRPWPDSFHVKFTAEGYQTLEDDVSLPNPGVFVKHYMLTKNWTTESDSFTINGFAGKEYDNQFTLETPNGSVLTDIEINLKWEDDVTYGLFKNKGLDTLSVEIQHNNESTSGSSEGTGNLTYWFLINDAPMDEMNVTGKNQTDFNIHIDVKTGEKIWRLLKFLKDKGNDFTLTFTYNYYIPNK